MSLKIYSHPNNYRAQKALVAGAYSEVEIAQPAFKMGVDNKKPAFLAKFPLGKVPCLETPQGPISESNAICRYVAALRPDKRLLGANYYEGALVSQWIEFSAHTLEPARAAWLYPLDGIMSFNQEIYDECKKDMAAALRVLNDHLLNNTFLVGHEVTLADITVVCALLDLYSKVFTPAFLGAFPNVTRWFTTCINQGAFAKVIGKVQFCTQEAKPKK